MGCARPDARLTTAVATIVVMVVLAACTTPQRATPEPGASGSPGATSETTSRPIPTDAADPDHAVAMPAKFDGKVYGDDLLLVDDETIPEDLLKRITSVKVKGKRGVHAHEVLSYGQFAVESKYFNIAAVDPGEFRRFTGLQSAQFDDQWERIAGGEIALASRLQKQLPVDGDGYLAVGSGETTHRIHVGAWSPAEVDSVDAMVNAKWGETLGLPERNAVMINTGPTSPQAVREAIKKFADVTIIALDIVQQTGIDPGTFQTVVPVGSFGDAVGVFRYTTLGGGRIAPEPAWVSSHIVTEQVPILGSVTCNKYMMPQLKAALGEIVARGLAKEIHPDEYAGCYYPRFIAGSSTLSNHSFGLALDMNVPGNLRGTVGEMNREVVAIFKYWGFAWGGDWSYTDPMHFELQRIVNPGRS